MLFPVAGVTMKKLPLMSYWATQSHSGQDTSCLLSIYSQYLTRLEMDFLSGQHTSSWVTYLHMVHLTVPPEGLCSSWLPPAHLTVGWHPPLPQHRTSTSLPIPVSALQDSLLLRILPGTASHRELTSRLETSSATLPLMPCNWQSTAEGWAGVTDGVRACVLTLHSVPMHPWEWTGTSPHLPGTCFSKTRLAPYTNPGNFLGLQICDY